MEAEAGTAGLCPAKALCQRRRHFLITQESGRGCGPSLPPLRTPYLVGSGARGWARRPGACFPGRRAQRPPETWSASPQGQGLAGRAARGRIRSGGRCLQSHVHQGISRGTRTSQPHMAVTLKPQRSRESTTGDSQRNSLAPGGLPRGHAAAHLMHLAAALSLRPGRACRKPDPIPCTCRQGHGGPRTAEELAWPRPYWVAQSRH